jgi:hypothetical protein
MSAPEDDDMGKFFVNTLIIFIIIFLMIFGLPLGLYAYKKISDMSGNKALIENLRNKEIDKYNELSDIFLFCNYMPIKKLFICGENNSDETDKKQHHNNEITKILEILQGKKGKIEDEYTKIKALSDTLINDNRVSRIKREFEEEQRLKKEAGEDGRFYNNQLFLWITSIMSGLNNIVRLTKDLVLGFGGFIITFSSALGKNKVVMGFLIIVFVIIIALSLTKPASKSKDGKNNGATSSNVGLSPTAIYNDILDTYKYYTEMVKNVNVDFLGTSTETEINEDDEDYDETLYRKIRGGKRYDNLSYINLSSLSDDIIKEINLIDGIKIDKTGDADKYYNIYLPSEKFSIAQADIKWKTSNNANNEKIWDIDCEKIGNQGSTSIPAFISNEGKCIINEAELKKADRPPSDPVLPTIYKTEYIK